MDTAIDHEIRTFREMDKRLQLYLASNLLPAEFYMLRSIQSQSDVLLEEFSRHISAVQSFATPENNAYIAARVTPFAVANRQMLEAFTKLRKDVQQYFADHLTSAERYYLGWVNSGYEPTGLPEPICGGYSRVPVQLSKVLTQKEIEQLKELQGNIMPTSIDRARERSIHKAAISRMCGWDARPENIDDTAFDVAMMYLNTRLL